MQPILEAIPVTQSNNAALALMAQLHRRAFTAQGEAAWAAATFGQFLASPGFEARLFNAGDRPIGFSLVRHVCDEAELISVAVDPSEQGNGFAKGILMHVLARLKALKVSNLFLEVRQDNVKAIQLYRSVGFKQIGERQKYYQTTDGKKLDAHVYSFIIE